MLERHTGVLLTLEVLGAVLGDLALLGSRSITLVLRRNTGILLTLKILGAVLRDLAVLRGRWVALVLASNADVLLAQKALLAVTSGLAVLVQLGQRSIPGSPFGDTAANLVAVLVRLAVLVNLADRATLGLGRRSQGKTGEHSRNNKGGLHFDGWLQESGKN